MWGEVEDAADGLDVDLGRGVGGRSLRGRAFGTRNAAREHREERGVYDMNGNASEWIDRCSGATCSMRGGYYFAPLSGCAVEYEYPFNTTDGTIGFRCCADPR
jgi:formylglycine-generating enzyme required for sulfatase activity